MPSAVPPTMPAPAPPFGLTNTGFRLGDDMHFPDSESDTDQSATSEPNELQEAPGRQLSKAQRKSTRKSLGAVLEQMEGIVDAFHAPESSDPEGLAPNAKSRNGNQSVMNKRTRQNLARVKAREMRKMNAMDTSAPLEWTEGQERQALRRDAAIWQEKKRLKSKARKQGRLLQARLERNAARAERRAGRDPAQAPARDPAEIEAQAAATDPAEVAAQAAARAERYAHRAAVRAAQDPAPPAAPAAARFAAKANRNAGRAAARAESHAAQAALQGGQPAAQDTAQSAPALGRAGRRAAAKAAAKAARKAQSSAPPAPDDLMSVD
ncbi:hypothetical protein IQ07DRAFT_601095 [Pyrenochaeta sp. DS3sAY3a]|nr:hypothetical protein IQ07DRAFT_601095 [Pyrenochaeta sp. DS3sAY3a]